jgi:hypothetical protein
MLQIIMMRQKFLKQRRTIFLNRTILLTNKDGTVTLLDPTIYQIIGEKSELSSVTVID